MTLDDQFFEDCFAVLEAGGSSSDFPTPPDDGLRTLTAMQTSIRHERLALDAKPQKAICPDGSDGCTLRCKIIKGEQHCLWVCRCPG